MKQEAAKCKGKRASHHLALTAIREGDYAWPWKGATLGLSPGGMRPAPAMPVLMELQFPCRPWAAPQLPGEAGERTAPGDAAVPNRMLSTFLFP